MSLRLLEEIGDDLLLSGSQRQCTQFTCGGETRFDRGKIAFLDPCQFIGDANDPFGDARTGQVVGAIVARSVSAFAARPSRGR